jgi:hypothetical protein
MSRKINRKFENPPLYFLACNTGTRFQVVCIERDLKRYILYLLLKNIFIKLQFSTNIMVNEVKTPIQNYFEKVLYENLTF